MAVARAVFGGKVGRNWLAQAVIISFRQRSLTMSAETRFCRCRGHGRSNYAAGLQQQMLALAASILAARAVAGWHGNVVRGL